VEEITMSDNYLDTAGDVAVVVSDVVLDGLDTGAALLDEIGPDLVDLADAAAVTAVASGRIGFRLLSRTLRFLGRHPKQAVIGLLVVAVVGAVASVACSNSDRTSKG
jgi:hypothetical protein